MEITINLPERQATALRELASRVGIAPDQLAIAAVSDLLDRSDESFETATRHVLRKNAELYKRLA